MRVRSEPPAENHHIIRSEDGRCASWAGAVDDLWKLGKPVGCGGPWKDTPVRAGKPSDPYLMTGYDRKSLTLSHEGKTSITISVEVDIDGNGNWKVYKSFDVPADKLVQHRFSDSFAAYWVRVVAGKDTVAGAQFLYE